MAVADSARAWSLLLRIVGFLVMAASLIGNYLLIYRGDTTFDGSPDVTTRIKLGEFLTQSSLPVAFGGILLAMSFIVSVYAARLDIDIVRDDEEETADVPPADISTWAPPPKGQ